MSESEAEEVKDDREDEAKEEKEKKIRIRKQILRPQPKLDSIRLCGDRGLKCLLDVFKDAKFKGKGYEFRDLELLLSKYTYWGHRLFPKMPFEELIEKLEKLGQKREVKFMADRLRKGNENLNDENKNENETNDDNVGGGGNEDDEYYDQLLSNMNLNEASNKNNNSNNNNSNDSDIENEAFFNAINM